MDERDRERQPIDARPEGTGRLRAGVGMAHLGAERAREAGEDAAWFLRERVLWPAEDGLEALGPRGRIGVFGGGGIAVAGVVATILIAGSGGSGSAGGTTEAIVVPERAAATAPVTPAAKPKKASKTTGPTLHGAPPDFAAAKNVKAGVGDGEAVGKGASRPAAEAPAQRGAAAEDPGPAAGDSPAATAKIGSTPAATASAAAQASSLANDEASGAVAEVGTDPATAASGEPAVVGPPAPKAAKRVARHFAEGFVVYETGGVDAKVRKAFGRTATKQLSKALLHRPPRQPASVKVPQAKVVNVVAGPSEGSVYEVSVSLLRVGVTSELRLEIERGPGKKWQVTNVLG